MSAIVRAAADELCRGRVVFALEGGYAPSGLAEGTAAVLEATLRAEAPRVAPVEMPAGSLLRRLVDSVVAVHGAHVPGLGAA
jgi:acetoin utilization deacetylase AcuC-like enzyme